MNIFSRGPSIPEQIQQDPIGFVDRLHEQHEAHRKAHREERRDLIQQCAFLTVSLRDENIFRRLALHPFWTGTRQKPKQNGRGKWAVYMMLRPTDEPSGKTAGKYGRVIDILLADGIAPEHVADAIKKRHGIGPIIKGRTNSESRNKNGPKLVNPEQEEKKVGYTRARAISNRDQDDSDEFISGDGDESEDPTMKRPVFSWSMKDHLLVRCTDQQFDIAFKAGKILIEADVSRVPNSTRFWVVATNIERC